jgi:pimeloyl-ACP methyl ester carboxylesterase
MEYVISKDGTLIAYEKIGNGQPVILVDGAMCYRSMSQLAALLSKSFTVVSYDRRGRGESGDTQPYTVQREIEDLGALINELGGAACVYGISSGAVLALKAAASLGHQIQRLAIYEPPFTFGAEARKASEIYTNSLHALLRQGHQGDAVELFLKTVGIPPQAIAGIRQSPGWPGMEALAPTLAYDNAIMGNGSVPEEEAQAVRIPSLVLVGGNSPEFMHEAADTIVKVLPIAQQHSLNGQTHNVAADALAPFLEEFFKEEV